LCPRVKLLLRLLPVGLQLESVVLMGQGGLFGLDDCRRVHAIVVLEWSNDFVAHVRLSHRPRCVEPVHVAVPKAHIESGLDVGLDLGVMMRGLPRRELVASVETLHGMLVIPQLLPKFDRLRTLFLLRETRDAHVVVLGNHRGLKLYWGLTLCGSLAHVLVGHRESLFFHSMSRED
jgi:hypothetical protein